MISLHLLRSIAKVCGTETSTCAGRLVVWYGMVFPCAVPFWCKLLGKLAKDREREKGREKEREGGEERGREREWERLARRERGGGWREEKK